MELWNLMNLKRGMCNQKDDRPSYCKDHDKCFSLYDTYEIGE